jgi:hypothetical protein
MKLVAPVNESLVMLLCGLTGAVVVYFEGSEPVLRLVTYVSVCAMIWCLTTAKSRYPRAPEPFGSAAAVMLMARHYVELRDLGWSVDLSGTGITLLRGGKKLVFDNYMMFLLEAPTIIAAGRPEGKEKDGG